MYLVRNKRSFFTDYVPNVAVVSSKKKNKSVRTKMGLNWTIWDILGHSEDFEGGCGGALDDSDHFFEFWTVYQSISTSRNESVTDGPTDPSK